MMGGKDMTVDEAIKLLEKRPMLFPYSMREKCNEALEMAIATLRAQQEEEKNDPLTLEDMSKMEGHPVWWKNLEFPDRPAQCKVIFHYGRHTEHISWTDDKHNLFRDYGKTWLAYRRPPKEP